ncbi:uncharacterized protein LOC118511538 isoform X2 [Anopheles stephensi]|uniref:uncharacterized protein LOC118511538 isoform X2 n=1 Tax=Anopheles stephensi TaxID=30069 RepID=UPI0016589476|nr:uncharacterized protein LOC118511538 isoform X2 [Anopheles stephensi]
MSIPQIGDEDKKYFKSQVMSKSIGSIEPYLMGENIESYLKRLDIFMEISDVVEKKKAKYMLSIGGASLYGVAEKVCAPEEPSKIAYSELVRVIKKHLKPQVNEVAERYKFRLVCQKEMSMSDFIIELKAAAQSCTFACDIAQTWEAARRLGKDEQLPSRKRDSGNEAGSFQQRK